MPDYDDHVGQLEAALLVLDVDWQPDQVADDRTRSVMLACALLGSAEAHLVGAEIDAETAGADLSVLRAAYGPVRDEVVASAMPTGSHTEMMLLVLRSHLLLDDLRRAAGPDSQSPDSEALAAAADMVGAVGALITQHYAASLEERVAPSAQESFTLAYEMVALAARRLARIREPGQDHEDGADPAAG